MVYAISVLNMIRVRYRAERTESPPSQCGWSTASNRKSVGSHKSMTQNGEPDAAEISGLNQLADGLGASASLAAAGSMVISRAPHNA